MALLSPGVETKEWDFTTIIPTVGTTQGAFAGDFVWGPINEVVTVSNEGELLDIFGPPNSNTFTSFFTAANFLSYTSTLRVVRAAGTTTAKNSTSANNGLYIPNRDYYELNYQTSLSSNTGPFAAKYAGTLGNSLLVSTCNSGNGFSTWAWKSYFNGAPGTSAYTANVNGANDEIHIIVVDEDGMFTGVANTVLEKFAYASKAGDATNDDGTTNYYVDVLKERSKYVYITSNPGGANATSWAQTASQRVFSQDLDTKTVSLSNGAISLAAAADTITAYGYFSNKETTDVSLVMTGAANTTVAKWVCDNIADSRKDVVAFISPQQTDVVNNAGNEVTAITSLRNQFNSSSYVFMDSGWKYQYDKYNQVYRWVPLNGDMAGLAARTDAERDPWYSFAGYNRGQIKNCVKLSWNPNNTQRDDLYKIGVNSVVTFPGDGTMLFGDKTMLAKPSAFDRVNVRRLFIVLEKAIAKAAKYSLFEFNDEFTRAAFVSMVEPYLRDVKGRRGITKFKVVCDETNNTPAVIDSNRFVGTIMVVPSKSINYILLNFAAVGTGVEFSYVIGAIGT